MARRHKKKRNQGEVELNLAAMLDMAFQLLTFFILTFQPPPEEGQIELRMPPPQPHTVVKNAKDAGSDEKNQDPAKGFNTVVISVFSGKSGDIASMGVRASIAEEAVNVGPNLGRLNEELRKLLSDKDLPIEQVMINVGSELHYGALMKVIEVCASQKLADGSKLTKLNLLETPETGLPPSTP